MLPLVCDSAQNWHLCLRVNLIFILSCWCVILILTLCINRHQYNQVQQADKDTSFHWSSPYLCSTSEWGLEPRLEPVALRTCGNKACLANYISEYIVDHAGEYIPHDKCIILASFTDGKLVKAVTSTGMTYLESLYSNQEEADMRMILHACSLSQGNGRLIICCDDTDVMVLLVYYQSKG